jgi:hypothetical protein
VYIKVCEVKLHKGHFSIAQTLLQDIIKESSYKRETEIETERKEKHCVSIVCFSVLISGTSSSFFL